LPRTGEKSAITLGRLVDGPEAGGAVLRLRRAPASRRLDRAQELADLGFETIAVT
jgi:hypothetical protein